MEVFRHDTAAGCVVFVYLRLNEKYLIGLYWGESHVMSKSQTTSLVVDSQQSAVYVWLHRGVR